jgi:hypothetical protein
MAGFEKMKILFAKKNITLYVLMGLFLLPVLAAHYIYRHADVLISKRGTNYGEFVQSSINWRIADAARPWQLVYWVGSRCDERCLANLDKLSRMRLSMGRKLYNLDLALVFSAPAQASLKLQTQLRNQNILWGTLDAKEQQIWQNEFQQTNIILFGTSHQAVLKYPKVFESKKMVHDLQLLIK